MNEEIRDLFSDAIQEDPQQAAAICLLGVAEALKVIANEMVRSNEDRVVFYSTMREFFERLLEDPQPGPDGSPTGSGQPAAAPECEVCGKLGSALCESGPLTRLQWLKHHNDCYLGNIEAGAAEEEAVEQAHEDMRDIFGPCPEES